MGWLMWGLVLPVLLIVAASAVADGAGRAVARPGPLGVGGQLRASASRSGIEANGEWLDGSERTSNGLSGVAASASAIIRSCSAGGIVWSSVRRTNVRGI